MPNDRREKQSQRASSEQRPYMHAYRVSAGRRGLAHHQIECMYPLALLAACLSADRSEKPELYVALELRTRGGINPYKPDVLLRQNQRPRRAEFLPPSDLPFDG